MNVNRSGIAKVVKSPYFVQKLIPRKDSVGRRRKMINKLQLFGRSINLFSVYNQLIGIKINGKLIELKLFFNRGIRIRAAHDSMDPGNQLLDIKRLCDIVISTRNFRIRTLKGMKEEIKTGAVIDTTIIMEPMDLVFSKGQQETFTSPELLRYISRQQERGSTNVVQYQVEYYKRIASSFAAFILTIIGASLSSRKRKGGMGLSLGIGLALSFTYIMLQTISSTFAINAGTSPLLAAWMPNLIFLPIAYFCYRFAPK